MNTNTMRQLQPDKRSGKEKGGQVRK